MKLTLLGTGNAATIPVYGCECKACQRARCQPQFQRKHCSAAISVADGKYLLIDANAKDLQQRFPAGSIESVLLTHYHMDHVSALFDLRWGEGEVIPVFGPSDANGCDDLYKHSGILAFKPPLQPQSSFKLAGLTITPLSLAHSKPTLGYVFERIAASGDDAPRRFAYLTDTAGLPRDSLAWLKLHPIDTLIIDCGYPPGESKLRPLNHSCLEQILEIREQLRPRHVVLTHIGHHFERWIMEHDDRFDEALSVATDGQEFEL